jgi:hypothetical protein
MGLAERKAVAAIKENEFKPFESQVKLISGVDLTIDFDWAPLEAHPECIFILEYKKCTEYIFSRVLEVFTKVCSDQMGKDAVKASLKGLKLIPVAGDLEFKDGILTVRNDCTGNGAYSADSIMTILEKNL